MSVDLIPIQFKLFLSTLRILLFYTLEGMEESWTAMMFGLVDCVQWHKYGRICDLVNSGSRRKAVEDGEAV